MSTRSYRSDLRTQQAELTRVAIAEAARAIFLTNGWSRTSIRKVAEAAGVSEATVYAVYGSKAALAGSLISSVDSGADVERVLAELTAAEGDPPAQLAAFIDSSSDVAADAFSLVLLRISRTIMSCAMPSVSPWRLCSERLRSTMRPSRVDSRFMMLPIATSTKTGASAS